jgi:cell division protein FtsQ
VSRRPVLSAEPRLAQRARAERKAHRRALLRRTGWVLAAAAPFAAAGWLLLASPWLVVDEVSVTGAERLTVAQVLAAADVELGQPLARVDTAGIADRVEALGPVLSVSVQRGWPSTLEVTVVEREPVAAVGRAPAFTLVDGTGAQLGTARSLPPGIVRLGVAHAGPDDPTTRAALSVLRVLPPVVRSHLAAVRAASPEQVTLVLRDGRTVLWGGVGEARAKAAVIVPLLRLPGTVYDVSTPSVVTRR